MGDQSVSRNLNDGARQVYEAAIRLYNAGDMAGFARAHGEQAVLVTPAGTFTGGAEILAYWTRQHDAFPDLHLTLDLVVASDDIVMTEWTWVGTNTGRLPRRDGTLAAPTGRRVQLQGMEVARVRDGRIEEYHIYWDGIALAHQLS